MQIVTNRAKASVLSVGTCSSLSIAQAAAGGSGGATLHITMGRTLGWLVARALTMSVVVSTPASVAQDQSIEPARVADLAVMNGRIWTGAEGAVPPDVIGAEPTSLAITDGRIIAVGDGKDMLPHIGPGTTIINAAKRRIVPGFTDSHTHIVSGGFQLERLNLRSAGDKSAFVEAVGRAAKNAVPGTWVQGGRWSVESWDQPEAPTRYWIDPVTGETPVFLFRMDGHQALVNSVALRMAGIDANGPADPKGGEIERDPKTKEPTGILKESAMDLVRRHIPSPSTDERFRALKRAMDYANQLGITSVHDMSDPDDLPVFEQATASRAMTVRITSYPQFEHWAESLPRLESIQSQGPFFRVAGMKQYMDGSLGSRTAYMREPFADAAADALYPRGQLTAWADSSDFATEVRALIERGLQPAVHAIGDQANHLLLDAYEEALKSVGRPNGLKPRVEHAQHLLVEDISRFARVGVVASMQPYHKADDGRYAEAALGKDRLAGSYAFRQLLNAHALLIFGTDWPIVSLEPMLGIDSAVNAKTLDGKTWLADHSLTIAEALYAYTVAPPKAIGMGSELGTIEVGMRADLVVLSDDPFTIPRDQLSSISAVWTIVNGAVVYSARR